MWLTDNGERLQARIRQHIAERLERMRRRESLSRHAGVLNVRVHSWAYPSSSPRGKWCATRLRPNLHRI